ncbi:hypothetical protein [Streptomyces beigongshangae]|uniref:hypothetical protein n=1 Tax=Streptomyces beigongshangae TaxID=2841597 RepID=UPI001C84FB61|nr:hypothetical protein [Streptomyces sp. REN17]
MKDNGGDHRTRWQRTRETIEGAGTDPRPTGLIDTVEPEHLQDYTQFSKVYPKQQLHLQYLHGAAQRAFETETRRSLKVTVECVLRNVLRDQRLYDAPGDQDLGAYLDREIDGIRARLGQDDAVAVSRGLNLGLGLGALFSVLLLGLPLLAGVRLLGLAGITLNCTDRWSLMGAFVCGGVGAFGSTLSVLLRVRSSEEVARRQTNGHQGAVVPAQASRSMRHEGVYRVFVGWILALSVYFLLSTGWVTVIDIPSATGEICAADAAAAAKGTAFWGFWCAVGFLAGFNERWAFGLLDRPGHRTGKAGPPDRRRTSATESNSG